MEVRGLRPTICEAGHIVVGEIPGHVCVFLVASAMWLAFAAGLKGHQRGTDPFWGGDLGFDVIPMRVCLFEGTPSINCGFKRKPTGQPRFWGCTLTKRHTHVNLHESHVFFLAFVFFACDAGKPGCVKPAARLGGPIVC